MLLTRLCVCVMCCDWLIFTCVRRSPRNLTSLLNSMKNSQHTGTMIYDASMFVRCFEIHFIYVRGSSRPNTLSIVFFFRGSIFVCGTFNCLCARFCCSNTVGIHCWTSQIFIFVCLCKIDLIWLSRFPFVIWTMRRECVDTVCPFVHQCGYLCMRVCVWICCYSHFDCVLFVYVDHENFIHNIHKLA